jgi:drug/metabolite transporter (DMT)-like permease
VNNKIKGPVCLVAILMVIMLGQFSSKTGANKLSTGDEFGYMYVAFGYGFLALRGVLWLFLLRIMDLSKAYPLQSLSYVLILGLSFSVFHEEVGYLQVLGCLFIISGSFVIYLD